MKHASELSHIFVRIRTAIYHTAVLKQGQILISVTTPFIQNQQHHHGLKWTYFGFLQKSESSPR